MKYRIFHVLPKLRSWLWTLVRPIRSKEASEDVENTTDSDSGNSDGPDAFSRSRQNFEMSTGIGNLSRTEASINTVSLRDSGDSRNSIEFERISAGAATGAVDLDHVETASGAGRLTSDGNIANTGATSTGRCISCSTASISSSHSNASFSGKSNPEPPFRATAFHIWARLEGAENEHRLRDTLLPGWLTRMLWAESAT